MEPRRALIRRRASLPEKFDPKRHKLNDAAIDFGIKEAKRFKDWPALESAVDIKIEQSHKFVAWWDGTVRGTGQPKKNGFRSETILSEAEAKKLTGIGKVQKHRIQIKLKAPEKYRQHLLGAAYLAANLADPDNVRGTFGTGNNEWHTPARYIELARKVLGKIDLDPATTEIAQRTVRAAEYFTFKSADDNGLTKPWPGRVWLNPPYSPKEIAAFVAKLCAEYGTGRTTAAIVLTHNYTDSAWFQMMARLASAICFTDHRVRFEDPDGVPCAPTQGQAFFYLGKSGVAKFEGAFSAIGLIVKPWKRK